MSSAERPGAGVAIAPFGDLDAEAAVLVAHDYYRTCIDGIHAEYCSLTSRQKVPNTTSLSSIDQRPIGTRYFIHKYTTLVKQHVEQSKQITTQSFRFFIRVLKYVCSWQA